MEPVQVTAPTVGVILVVRPIVEPAQVASPAVGVTVFR